MIVLPGLAIYNSTSNITQETVNVELYTDVFDKFSCKDQKGELEEFLNISNITSKDLQGTKGPRVIKAYKKNWKQKRDGLMVIACC